MTFNYNNKEYELLELYEPNRCASCDCLAIFEIAYIKFEKNKAIKITKDEYEKNEIGSTMTYRFINYFYGVEDKQTNIENAKYFIDHEYDKEFDELKYLLKNLKKAQVEFEKDFEEDNDTKGSLDGLEYAQSDIYDWVNENIKLDD